MAPQLEPAEVEAAVNELQLKLDRLKVLYDQYFLGITKREPLVALKDVVRTVHLLDSQQIRNTGLRFRLRNLVQKFNVYRTYWARTKRAIEAGTYVRDLARVRRKYARDGVEMPKLGQLRTAADVERAMSDAAEQVRSRTEKPGGQPAGASPIPVRGKPADALRREVAPQEPRPATGQRQEPSFCSVDEADAVLDGFFDRAVVLPTDAHPARPAPADSASAVRRPPAAGGSGPAPVPGARPVGGTGPRPAAAAAAPRARPHDARGDNLSADRLQSIYRRMVKAKQMIGESADSVTREGLAQTINRQLPRLRQLHPDKEIDFQVVIRQGKVVIRATPKD